MVFLGPPGAGKGTQARRAAGRWGVPAVATGDLLRDAVAAGTSLGRAARRYMEAGELVPDSIMVGLVAEALARPEATKGFVLDGFPRTVAQAEALDRLLADRGLGLDRVVVFRVSEPVLLVRLGGRRVCRTCGTNYHLSFSPPDRDGVCDRCGGDLVRRPDDDEATIRRRLEVYERDTRPLVDYYRARGLLTEVLAEGTVDEVFEALTGAVEGHR